MKKFIGKEYVTPWEKAFDRVLTPLDEFIHRQTTRQQERQMRKFKSCAQAQRFLPTHVFINNLFRVSRHLLKAAHYRIFRERAFSIWDKVTCVQNMEIA